MQISPQRIQQFQTYILDWYEKNKRDLPWRSTRNPYNILISEVMLQQTQVTRVIEKYRLWINKFPTIYTLAQAKFADVLSIWSGLGYNRRALYLHKLAIDIVTNYQGVFPNNAKSLKLLPGIGEYTANALLCFAFDKQIPVVDTNIKKVILTQFLMVDYADNKVIEEIALRILPKGKAYIWNQALMDYSSLMLKKEKIKIPKQSKFKDSDRYYRGAIMKLLLKKSGQSFLDILAYFQSNNQNIMAERLDRIINTLIRDSLVIHNEDKNEFILP